MTDGVYMKVKAVNATVVLIDTGNIVRTWLKRKTTLQYASATQYQICY